MLISIIYIFQSDLYLSDCDYTRLKVFESLDLVPEQWSKCSNQMFVLSKWSAIGGHFWIWLGIQFISVTKHACCFFRKILVSRLRV